ncbi:TRAP transporter substrate-binding protein [Aliamphritea spongicola]|uniref:TRAP transporter substrate-binding protein n=1 Tax=Aliamphritea spongicola TaxID=707589 RepID=UPI00196A221F|nr:TRAP transporter substrate-binding protein DctP [Aliamphritea spongicola]MBN3564231.1 TRAP transporter substrate-binding protein DctP [Aliamphritea spongicola]
MSVSWCKSYLLPASLLLSLCLSLIGCINQEPDSVSWRLQTQATKESIDYQGLLELADNVSKMSSGRLQLEIIPSDEVAAGPDIYTAVQERRIEMGNGWPNWWSGQHPAWALMNAGPFDFMNLDASMMFFLAGDGTKLANNLSSPDGIMWRPAWWPGMEFGLISKDPITGLDDLRNKKVRIGPGLPSEVLTAAAGAYTIPLVPNEIRPALENGDIDAVEWTTARGAWDLGLHDIGKNAIVPAIWQPSVLSDFLINQAAYDELAPDLQAILESAIKSYTLSVTMKAKVSDFEAFKQLADSGVNINRWSQEDIDRWREESDKVLVKYAQRDPLTKEIIEKKRSFKKEFNQYYDWFGNYEQQ